MLNSVRTQRPDDQEIGYPDSAWSAARGIGALMWRGAFGYALAVSCVAIAFGVRLLLSTTLEGQSAFPFFTPAVVVASALHGVFDKATDQALRAGRETELRAECIAKLVEDAGAIALVGAKGHNVRVRFKLDPKADLVLADKIHVQQVLLNLLRNAMEAMDKSTQRERMIPADSTDDESVEIGVPVMGIGIAPEMMAQVFQPFIATQRHGMGIELSISRTMVEAHGGRIWIEPNTGSGAILRFTLRARSEDMVDAI